MSLCDLCAEPGACCQRFMLSISTWDFDGFGGPWREIQKLDVPFFPIEPCEEGWKDEKKNKYHHWYFGCAALLPNGRCGEYENRPQVCRDYAPRTDALCVMSGLHKVPRLPLLPGVRA